MTEATTKHCDTTKRTEVNDIYGLRFYEEMRSRGLLHLLTNRLDYAGIQRLKQANREETIEIFFGFGYATVQAMKRLSPTEAAAFFAEQMAAQAAAMPIVFFT